MSRAPSDDRASIAGWLAMALLPILAACGDDASTDAATDAPIPSDADAARDGAVDAAMPTAPTPPVPPTITPCPPGWREIAATESTPAFCDPYPDAPADCPLSEMHLPGTPGCDRVTTPCPADGWPTDVPETIVLYVRADAAPGGDGTRDAPFAEIADAARVAPDGSAIAIAPGSYGPAVIDTDVAVRGACADVIVTGPDRAPALGFENADASVDNLRISGSDDGIGALAATLRITRVVVAGIRGPAISVVGSTVEASRVRLHDVGDTGVYVGPSAAFTGSELAFTGAMRSAVRAADSTTIVRDALVSITAFDPEVYVGNNEDDTTFERVAVVGEGTMFALRGSSLTVRDSSVFGPPAPETPLASSIIALEGSHITVERISHRRGWSFALAAVDAESTLVATDVLIRGEADDALHDAIEVGDGARADLTRVHVEGARSIGLLATGAGTTVVADDLSILDTRPDTTGVYGRALQVQTSASFVGHRVRVVGSHEVAVVASTDATVTLDDLRLEETLERNCAAGTCASGGIGLGAYVRGRLSATRFLLADNALAGAQLAVDGELDLSDGAVTGNPVGVNVQVPGYDVSRLTDRVYFSDNGINLDSEELPLPPATAPL